MAARPLKPGAAYEFPNRLLGGGWPLGTSCSWRVPLAGGNSHLPSQPRLNSFVKGTAKPGNTGSATRA